VLIASAADLRFGPDQHVNGHVRGSGFMRHWG